MDALLCDKILFSVKLFYYLYFVINSKKISFNFQDLNIFWRDSSIQVLFSQNSNAFSSNRRSESIFFMPGLFTEIADPSMRCCAECHGVSRRYVGFVSSDSQQQPQVQVKLNIDARNEKLNLKTKYSDQVYSFCS